MLCTIPVNNASFGLIIYNNISQFKTIYPNNNLDYIDIQITDDGQGGVKSKAGSFGIAGIQERVDKLNGEITIASDVQGTKIGVRIPLDR